MIDWFTVAVQAVNFLILVWVLKIILYRRILKTMDDREADLRRRFHEADELRRQAEDRARSLDEARAAWRREHQRRLDQARDEVQQEKQARAREAREDVEARRRRWLASLAREQEGFLDAFGRETGESAVSAVRSAFKEMADTDLETRLFDNFQARLRALPDDERDRLRSEAREHDGACRMETAFPVEDGRRREIRRSLSDLLDREPELEWATRPELLCGVRFRIGGLTAGWNLAQYLQGFGDDFRRRLAGARGGDGGDDGDARRGSGGRTTTRVRRSGRGPGKDAS